MQINSNKHFQFDAAKLDGVIVGCRLGDKTVLSHWGSFSQESHQLIQKAVDSNSEGALVSLSVGKSPSSFFKSGKYRNQQDYNLRS